jgi:hypothetical protein
MDDQSQFQIHIFGLRILVQGKIDELDTKVGGKPCF